MVVPSIDGAQASATSSSIQLQPIGADRDAGVDLHAARLIEHEDPRHTEVGCRGRQHRQAQVVATAQQGRCPLGDRRGVPGRDALRLEQALPPALLGADQADQRRQQHRGGDHQDQQPEGRVRARSRNGNAGGHRCLPYRHSRQAG
jgi:hypothetical protein